MSGNDLELKIMFIFVSKNVRNAQGKGFAACFLDGHDAARRGDHRTLQPCRTSHLYGSRQGHKALTKKRHVSCEKCRNGKEVYKIS